MARSKRYKFSKTYFSTEATSKVHLKQERQNLQSTKEVPSKTLPTPPTTYLYDITPEQGAFSEQIKEKTKSIFTMIIPTPEYE